MPRWSYIGEIKTTTGWAIKWAVFIDHISSNVNDLDYWDVVSIFDAIVARIRLELPTVISLAVIAESALNYQNDVVLVVAPFICHAHGVNLEALIHPESVRGKGILYVHFSITMRHVHRYVQGTGRDLCPQNEYWASLLWEVGDFSL